MNKILPIFGFIGAISLGSCTTAKEAAYQKAITNTLERQKEFREAVRTYQPVKLIHNGPWSSIDPIHGYVMYFKSKPDSIAFANVYNACCAQEQYYLNKLENQGFQGYQGYQGYQGPKPLSTRQIRKQLKAVRQTLSYKRSEHCGFVRKIHVR